MFKQIHASRRAAIVVANDAARRHTDSDDAERLSVDALVVSAPALSLAPLSAALPALRPSSSHPAPITTPQGVSFAAVLARPPAQPAMPQGVPSAVVAQPPRTQGIAACRVKGYHGPQAARFGRLNPSTACENPACRCTDRLLAHARCATCGFVYCGPCFGMGNGSRALKFARPSRLARRDDRAARFGDGSAGESGL